jgi:uncharacterized damage-inducible protein DinB
MLTEFLDYQRAVVLRKVAGLDDEQLRRPMTASGLTMLGFVKHIAYVERWWFRVVFAGEPVEVPWTDDDPDADWRVEPDDTTDAIVALYLEEIERSRAIASRAELDEIARNPRVQDDDVTMRWILLHMIEEIARHLGHADIMREALDGATGD